ncbi:uncharacterized protein LACBIDRAFT_303781 [Laccaria bicolor S238N-H82]|uniref:Predicted protein n=1 Tax=Laccaria bicolor (strain S238N-H82 / ATCC MYA-4686) TaxID=486041 RepID=B0DKA8_LACBS|nr:uncharacterized protein LACBIDRAFT_303781 [Laccaria bicolor S238N-H82]EDR04910.1 predicted protein [Laccaria bicolor S238N-H82]|eukprot:XP_001884300.1 predicted protein [Laccaria bicolor S238N-H82]
MPKIRKKTTNRAKTNDRAKLKHKVKESRKKKVKAAKKNPQWKSKHKKDPGIPNDFPYKDQILAEVAEQRRVAAEEKQKRKEEKRLLAARAKAGLSNEEGDDAVSQEQMEVDHDDELELTGKDRLNVGSDGIASLSAKLVNKALKPRPKPVEVEEEDEEEEEDDVPVLINRDLPNLKSVLDSADVIVQVLDARDPMSCRSLHLEMLAKESGKKMLLVVNKIDACPREAVASWTAYLRSEYPALLFRSATAFLPTGPEQVNVKAKGKGKGKVTVPADDAVGVDSVLECLGQWAQEKRNEVPLTVAVVGITNVGKSSFVNSLLRKRALPVYSLSSSSRGPTTTELPQETTLEVAGKQIRFIDTPGLSFAAHDDEEEGHAQDQNEIRGRDILLRNKGRIDRLKDPSFPVAHIVARGNAEDLMLLYSIPAFAKGDAEAFLSGVARANQLIKKKGQLDLTGAARIVLRDWSLGKLARYTTASAPAPSSDNAALDVAKLYANDEPILASLKTRKEMRKAGGVVKFSAGAVETRKVAVDEPWVGLAGEDDEEGEESEEDDLEVGQDEEDEDEECDLDEEDDEEEEMDEGEDTDDDEDDEEDTLPPFSNKQKRKRSAEPAPPAPPSKKVAFAADPKTSKQARKAGSLKIKAQQQKPAPVPAKKVEEPKQPLKAVETAKSKLPVKEKKVVEKKVANVAAKKAKGSKPAKSPTTKGPEAYDFSKFF